VLEKTTYHVNHLFKQKQYWNIMRLTKLTIFLILID